MADHAAQIDTRIEVVTPENIAFQYRLAGPFRRGIAYLIDLGIRIGVVVAFSFVAMMIFGAMNLVGLGGAAILLLYFVLDWFYGGIFEGLLMNGQTPGKYCLKLRVVSVTGQPITVWQAVLRNLMRAGDAQPVLFFVPTYQLGLLTMAFNRRFQRLGDLLCGTMVVIEEPQQLYGVVRVTEPAAIALASELPPKFEASRELARALSAYVQRRLSLGAARRAEIARHLGEPLRERFGLPPGVSHDLLLCALYHKVFIAETLDEGASPFRMQTPFARPAAGPAALEVPTSLVMRAEDVVLAEVEP